MAPKPKKKNTGSYQFIHYVSLLNNLIDRMRTKSPRSSGVKSAVDSTWRLARINFKVDLVDFCFDKKTYANGKVGIICRHFVLEDLRMPDSSIQLHQLP